MIESSARAGHRRFQGGVACSCKLARHEEPFPGRGSRQDFLICSTRSGPDECAKFRIRAGPSGSQTWVGLECLNSMALVLKKPSQGFRIYRGDATSRQREGLPRLAHACTAQASPGCLSVYAKFLISEGMPRGIRGLGWPPPAPPGSGAAGRTGSRSQQSGPARLRPAAGGGRQRQSRRAHPR